MMWLFWLFMLNSCFILFVAIREVRKPAHALNWIVMLLLLPIVGFAIYLSISTPVQTKRHKLTNGESRIQLPESYLHSTLIIANAIHCLSVQGLQTGRVQILKNGVDKYTKLLQSIESAQYSIDLEYYIYRTDDVGRRITELLIKKSLEGVTIRFMRDGVGSHKFPKQQISRMMSAGIECRIFFPVRFPWVMSHLNYRNHCKNVVIDRKLAYTGGMNVGEEYTGLSKKVGFWRDTHVRMFGNAAEDIGLIFNAHWKIAASEKTSKRGQFGQLQNFQNLKSAAFKYEIILNNSNEETESYELFHESYIHTLEGNPELSTQIIRQAFFICLSQASRSIDITTPYFLPDTDIIMALKTAVLRNVRVRLLVPLHVDHKIVGAACRTYYGELLDSGVQIYQYDKGVLHAKQMIIDEEISEIGAANFDMRSFRLNYEVCEMYYCVSLAKVLTKQFELDIQHSIILSKENLLRRTFPERMIEQSARLFSPLL